MATIRCLPQFVRLIIETDPSTVNVKDQRTRDTSAAAFATFASDKYPHKTVLDATALHYACLADNLELIEMLLKAGADWNLTDYKKRKPEDLISDAAIAEQFQKLKCEEEPKRKAKEEEEAKRKVEEEAAKKAKEEEAKNTNQDESSADESEMSESDSEEDAENRERACEYQ